MFSLNISRKMSTEILAVLLLYLIGNSKARSPRYTLLWTEIDCQWNSDIIKSINCVINQPEQKHFDIEVIHGQNLAQAMGNISLDIVRPSGKNMHLFSFETDYCKFLSEPAKNNIMVGIREGFEKYGTFPKACPIEKGSRTALKKFTFDANRIPIFTPEMNFIALANFYTPAHVFIANFKVMGRLEENTRSRLKSLGGGRV